jgi:cell shape-determining protein MreC
MRFSSQRILPFVLVLTLALCLAPGRVFGITSLLSEVMNLVLGPFAVAGNQLGEWLRPPQSGLSGSPNDPELLLHLQQERDEFERLYIAEQARVDSLQQQLEQLQMVTGEQLRIPVRPVIARVASRSPAPLGAVMLNRGSNHGVVAGTVAVHNAVHLLGRVTHEVTSLHSSLLPLANPSSGLIDAAIIPRDRADMPMEKATRIQLKGKDDGTLRGDVDRMLLVNAGDLVRLLDGRVESVETNDAEPLRNSVIVRPQYQVSQVAYVTLKIELDDGAGADGVGARP